MNETKENKMNNYQYTHISSYKDAIDAPVKMIAGEYKGRKGYITNVFTSIIEHRPDHVFEIELEAFGENDDVIHILSSDGLCAQFAIDITLEDGKKYLTMNGDVVTMHELRYNQGWFYVNNSEVCHDPKNTSNECYEANGFAYHYDCGCNILKEYIEPK
jgi:hypothetical protein